VRLQRSFDFEDASMEQTFSLKRRNEKKCTDVDQLVNIFDVDLVTTDSANKVHQPKSGNHSIILEFVSFRELPHVHQKLQKEVDWIQEIRNALSKLFIHVWGLEIWPQLADEESPWNIVTLRLRHEERIQLVDELRLDVIEMFRQMIFRDDHTVKDVDRIVPQLIVVTQAEVKNMSN
jgi:hypothetical protein